MPVGGEDYRNAFEETGDVGKSAVFRDEPLGLRQAEAAQRLGISANRLNEVVLGKRRVTADTAIRLSRFLKTSPQFWMRLQADWDLHREARRAAS